MEYIFQLIEKFGFMTVFPGFSKGGAEGSVCVEIRGRY